MLSKSSESRSLPGPPMPGNTNVPLQNGLLDVQLNSLNESKSEVLTVSSSEEIQDVSIKILNKHAEYFKSSL